MPEYSSLVGEAGERVISTIRTAQDAAVSAVSQVSGTVGTLIPALPATPVTSSIPNPKAVVETYFDFAEELLKVNKQYALALVKALEPVTAKVFPNAKKKATRKAPTQN